MKSFFQYYSAGRTASPGRTEIKDFLVDRFAGRLTWQLNVGGLY